MHLYVRETEDVCIVERLFSSSLRAEFVSLSAPWGILSLYHFFVPLLKRESVNSSHKFKKQEEINVLDFQRDVSSIGLMLSNSSLDFFIWL